jgi:hypothetical protein
MFRLLKKLAVRLSITVAWARDLKVHWAKNGPPKADVVIFDVGNAERKDLLPLCGETEVMLMDVSGLHLHVNWRILARILRLLFQGVSLRVAYLADVLRQVSPAIVVTYIDNSDLFYKVARLNGKKMRFLAIQNGARYDVAEMSPMEARRIFIPEFACFGEYERDLYTAKGAQVGRFLPLGSLRESLFRRYSEQASLKSSGSYNYDLCVVAEASPGWDEKYPGFEDSIGKIAQYAVRLSQEKGLRLVIAGKRDINPIRPLPDSHSHACEVSWYKKYIGTAVPVTPRVRDEFSTYALMSLSHLSLALMSTSLREGASRGCRFLACNFSGDRRWDFCVDGIWSLKDDCYESFSKRVLTILGMSKEDWSAASKQMRSYVMNNDDQNPTYAALSRIISDSVAERAGD